MRDDIFSDFRSEAEPRNRSAVRALIIRLWAVLLVTLERCRSAYRVEKYTWCLVSPSGFLNIRRTKCWLW